MVRRPERYESMDATVSLRAATAGDIPGMVAIWRESMVLHAALDPAYRPQAAGHEAFGAFVAQKIGSADAALQVAMAGDRVAAYGICVLRRRPELFEPGLHGLVTDLDVAGAYRRHGLGERILEALCSWLRARGVERIEAEMITANAISVGFWRKQGFVPYYQAMFRAV